jgi:hypothetical protein
MKNFKYFSQGRPGQPEDPMYALYQPVFDCFLIVTPSKLFVNQLKALLSSRFSLHLVCISSAENYEPYIFDNEHCDRWTFSNKNELWVNRGLWNLTPIDAKNLVFSDKVIDWDVNLEKRFAHLALFFLQLFEDYKKMYLFSEVDIILSELLPIDQDVPEYFNIRLKKQVMQILYTERDPTQAEEQIINLIQQYPTLFDYYNGYAEHRQ